MCQQVTTPLPALALHRKLHEDAACCRFKKIVAEVEAVAKSKTCVRGHAKAGNKVYSKCIQEIYAIAFAKVCAAAASTCAAGACAGCILPH